MELRNSLDRLPPRSKERRILIEETAELYGVSTVTIYRALKEYITPKSVRRADYGKPVPIPIISSLFEYTSTAAKPSRETE